MFKDTKDCTNIYLQSACSNVSSAFGIDWPAVRWSDLRKPLYSGVAAALYTLLTLGSQSMPGSVTDQANLWVQMYGGQSETFSNVADQPTTTGKIFKHWFRYIRPPVTAVTERKTTLAQPKSDISLLI